jgi:hypothetical protein
VSALELEGREDSLLFMVGRIRTVEELLEGIRVIGTELSTGETGEGKSSKGEHCEEWRLVVWVGGLVGS